MIQKWVWFVLIILLLFFLVFLLESNSYNEENIYMFVLQILVI